jgi:hypothetical protein
MHEAAGVCQQGVKCVGSFATLAVVVMVTRLARKALRAVEQSEKGDPMAEGRAAKSELAGASVVAAEGERIDS